MNPISNNPRNYKPSTQATRQGAAAAKAGRPASDNPYTVPCLAQSWQNGHHLWQLAHTPLLVDVTAAAPTPAESMPPTSPPAAAPSTP